MPKQPREYIQCRYCDFRAVKWFTNREGKRMSGWVHIKRHNESAHLEEMIDLIAKSEQRLAERLGPHLEG